MRRADFLTGSRSDGSTNFNEGTEMRLAASLTSPPSDQFYN